jgi:hypothetical protein
MISSPTIFIFTKALNVQTRVDNTVFRIFGGVVYSQFDFLLEFETVKLNIGIALVDRKRIIDKAAGNHI